MNADVNSPPEPQLAAWERLVESDPGLAAARLRTFLADNPLSAEAYRLLARADRATADSSMAGTVRSSAVSGAQMRLHHAARALQEGDLETAEIILRQRLRDAPADVEALRLMAALATELDYHAESEELLRLAVEIAPDHTAAKYALALWLHQQSRDSEALPIIDELLQQEPAHDAAKSLKAAALGRVGRFEESVALYEELLQRAPQYASLWMNYGYTLTTMGRSEEGLRANRQAIAVAPLSGEAWWTLSNLKTVTFTPEDVTAMQAALEAGELGADDRFYLHFALGKAFEDSGDPGKSFGHYEAANRIRRQSLDYDPGEISSEVTQARRTFSAAFFDERRDRGSVARDPIFIIGMPRSGSTLVEQILASHPMVEGTMELPHVPILAKRLGRAEGKYIETVGKLPPAKFEPLGRAYVEHTRRHRHTDRPFFIDKMPNNWIHVPLIHLILPKAKIIDARRHPMACGLSNFKQHYMRGQAFSYDLTWIGRYYADYVRLMAHIDTVLPGRVHRVIHEQLVDDTENEVRRLLDYLELPFDEACLRFYENQRAVRTPSSEQVRRPINRRGVDQWRAFEPFLEPLKAALGDVLTCYPEAPEFPAD